MSYEAEEAYDVYKERIVKARKSHKCQACGVTIGVGHYYCRLSTVYEGTAETVIRCGSCQVTHVHLRKLCRESGEPMWPDERLQCGLVYEDEWGESPPDEIADLPFLSPDERSGLLASREVEL